MKFTALTPYMLLGSLRNKSQIDKIDSCIEIIHWRQRVKCFINDSDSWRDLERAGKLFHGAG